MKCHSRIVLRLSTAVILLLSVAYSIVLSRDNARLRSLLSQDQPWKLSSDEGKLLLSDLTTSNTANLYSWKLYFEHALELQSKLAGRTLDSETFVDLYRTYEQPGRSNYFADLLLALSYKRQYEGLTRQKVIGYLGKPDESTTLRGTEYLRYFYTSYRQPSAAMVCVSNDAVSLIGWNRLAGPEGEPK